MKKKFLGLFLLAGITVSAIAQTTTAIPTQKKEGVNIEKKDKKRINEGVKNGQLTKAEAKGLREDVKDLQSDVKVAKADGKVNKAERKVLAKDQAKLSREIYNKKNNARKRV